MEKKTIGKFIAVLRKASGMTQRELGERLFVSDKTVSRWECDECTPELSLIPAIAEIFGVTCDELLRGERIYSGRTEGKEKPRTEKQLRAIVSRVTAGIKILIFISLAFSAVGLVSMLGLSYGAYRPVIGFFIMLVFEICAALVASVALIRSKDVRDGSDLLMSAGDELKGKFDKILGEYSFIAFFAVFVSVVLSLPLVVIRNHSLVESVLSFESYFAGFLIPSVLLSVYLFLMFRRPYCEWVTCGRVKSRMLPEKTKEAKKMNTLQLSFVTLATLLFFVAPYLDFEFCGFEFYDIFLFAPFLCLLADIVIFVVFVVKNKKRVWDILLYGVRNVLMIIPSLIVNMSFGIYYEYENGVVAASGVDWSRESLWCAAVICLSLILLCSIAVRIKNVISYKRKETE